MSKKINNVAAQNIAPEIETAATVQTQNIASQEPATSNEQPDFFTRRITNELEITPEQNQIRLKHFDLESNTEKTNLYKIFDTDDDGNITILPFTLRRELIQYDNQRATPDKPNINNSRVKTWRVTRFETPREYTDPKGKRKLKKYDFPKGAETVPFITPGLIEKWERREKITTLVATEGYFKSFKGYMNGLDIVGLSSISHYKQRDTQTMYTDVLTIIKDCLVENFIILYDGDARNISLSDLTEKTELTSRPAGFINSARNVRELLKDFNVDVYFACINSAEITGQPKGLDDLYCSQPTEAEAITKALTSFSAPQKWFNRFSIKFDLGKLYKFFCFDSLNAFFELHKPVIENRKFVFYGTEYQYDPENGKIDIIVPGEASNYFRVGDDYYKFIHQPNKYEQLEKKFVRRLKSTITEDHPTGKGKKPFTAFIPKYEAFCNVPDHVNFRQIINNCFNIYAPFTHEPEPGECSTILSFFSHLFGEQYEIGLDYVQLLYQKPAQILPILCLVSKENNTGKSTFIKFLKAIFGQNCTVIGNEDLANSFNSFWITKTIIGIEETFVEKKSTTERIKALSTADKITMNAKGRDQVEIDFFGKFILASNNEDTFIYASAEDERYWVRKIPVIPADKLNIRMMEDMIEEIPAFLYFLNSRKMFTNNESRMWFNPRLLKTEALEKLKQNNRPGIEKEIIEYLKTIYFEFGETEVLLTPTDINNFVLKRKQDNSYLSRILRENMKVHPWKNSDGREATKAYSIPYWGTDDTGEVIHRHHKLKGRPFVFNMNEILTPYDLANWRAIHGDEAREIVPLNKGDERSGGGNEADQVKQPSLFEQPAAADNDLGDLPF